MTIPERENEVTKKYAQVCLEVGKEANVASVDLWTKIQEKSDWQNLLRLGSKIRQKKKERKTIKKSIRRTVRKCQDKFWGSVVFGTKLSS